MSNTKFTNKKLFHNQVHTFCKISCNENSTENIQVILEYRIDRPGQIVGYLIGNIQTFYSLGQIINKNVNFEGLHFKTVIRETGSEYYESKRFIFETITKSEAQIYTVAKINFLEIYKKSYINREVEEMSICFQITPPL